METDLNTKIPMILFGTDAQGAGEGDHGGYGVVGTVINNIELRSLLSQGELPGRTIRRLGELDGVKNPADLRPTVPITRVEKSVFDPKRWSVLMQGRWDRDEHITLGECRAVIKLLHNTSNHVDMHDCLIISLQDNMTTACAMRKGRSPSFGLLRLLRKKAAICLACGFKLFLPWVESHLQPADDASRSQLRDTCPQY